jgi:hypothetical protein
MSLADVIIKEVEDIIPDDVEALIPKQVMDAVENKIEELAGALPNPVENIAAEVLAKVTE